MPLVFQSRKESGLPSLPVRLAATRLALVLLALGLLLRRTDGFAAGNDHRHVRRGRAWRDRDVERRRRLHSKRTRSNSEGVYSFTGLSTGDHIVQAVAPGLAVAEPVKITLREEHRL